MDRKLDTLSRKVELKKQLKNIFKINSLSENFSVLIQIENCKDNLCYDEANVQIILKSNPKFYQNIKSENMPFSINEKNKIEINKSNADSEPIIFGDFNFDEFEDVAIRNGNNGTHNSPSYDIYLYNFSKKIFLFNKKLTEISQNYSGMFKLDKKNKIISAFTTNGAHNTYISEFKFIKKEIVLVKFIHQLIGDTNVLITEKTITKGKWKRKKYNKNIE